MKNKNENKNENENNKIKNLSEFLNLMPRYAQQLYDMGYTVEGLARLNSNELKKIYNYLVCDFFDLSFRTEILNYMKIKIIGGNN